MHADIAGKREAIADLCGRHGVVRLDVFGSAARGGDFDPVHSDADFLATFAPSTRDDLAAFMDFKEALEALLGRPVDLVERDAALLLDMVMAAGDALSFVEGLDETGLRASRLHQNAVIRSLEVIGEAASKVSSATQTASQGASKSPAIGQ